MAHECGSDARLPERIEAAAAAQQGAIDAAKSKSMREESYTVADLCDSERRALADFKHAIAAAAEAGEFSIPSSRKEGDQSLGIAAPIDAARAGADSCARGVSLWEISLLDGSASADVVLLKFLRAREFKVEAAVRMLKNTMTWRKNFGCDGGSLLEEEFDAAIDGTAFYFGCDKGGHPVCYNLIDARICSEGQEERLEKLLRWRVKLMEKGLKLLDFHPQGISSMLQVVDLKNFSMKKEARAALLDSIQLLSDNYPELVSKLMLVNVPWYCNALYVMISPFLTQRTKNKISIASKAKTSKALFNVISPDNVPALYGGLGKLNDERSNKPVKAPITESCVKAGSMLIIEIQVNEGDEVSWELSIPGWDVNYGAEFTPSIEGGYTVIVEKSRKISSSQEGSISNSFITTCPGSLLLTIDNSASRKRKMVIYKYLVRA